MPIYEYSCEKCGTKIDVLQKMDDPAPARCEKCNTEGSMSRLVSRTSFVLKGGGWYSDLYGSSKKDASATNPSPSSTSVAPTSSAPATTDSTAKKDTGGSGSSGGSTPSSSSGTSTPSTGGSGSGGTGGSSSSPT